MPPSLNDRAAWITGGKSSCSQPPETAARPRRLVLLGAPGVGKGTQALMLSRKVGGCQLSTGDVFRAAKTLGKEDQSPAVRSALEAMSQGALVQDETVLEMVRERVQCLRCGGGILLDGFPRTVAQATALDQLFNAENIRIDAVLSYEMPLEIIIERLGGRRTCASCKAVYHVKNQPSVVEGICDQCGGELIQRGDDTAEAIQVRMKAYEESTAPLAAYYRKQGLLLPISAMGTPEEVHQRTMRLLGEFLDDEEVASRSSQAPD